MKLGNVLQVVVLSACTAIFSVWGYGKYMTNHYDSSQAPGKVPANYAGFFGDKGQSGGPADFTSAATSATPAVVHIKTKTKARQVTNNLPKQQSPFADLFGDDDPFSQFFGGNGSRSYMQPEQRASGSGVLISDDGYIVTNNHVIADADEITVTTADRRVYKGVVISSDPNSDIAVLKIEGTNFPYLVYGNSDDVRLGQWVLAIGYPLTLDVTVTAGIISAKSRFLGLNRGDHPIESYLQTDAAVNPGNSGGALVNTDGQLIGINSAIASPTGSYAGYSYAIPVNIVKKIVNDLIKFGTVQRAYLGIQMDPNYQGAGVSVSMVTKDGAAAQSSLKSGDVITKLNNIFVNSQTELQEQLAGYKPGDKVNVTYSRNGAENTTVITLKNTSGNYDIVKAETMMDKLGGQLENLDASTAKANNISGGVVVKKIDKGGALDNTRMQEGFIITSVNGVSVKNMDDFSAALKNANGSARLNGIYPGYEGAYPYILNLNGSQQDNNDDGNSGSGDNDSPR